MAETIDDDLKSGHEDGLLAQQEAEDGSHDRTRDYDAVFHLSYNDGKAVQEILNRYVSEELRPRTSEDSLYYEGPEGAASTQRDIAYIEGLAELFDE